MKKILKTFGKLVMILSYPGGQYPENYNWVDVVMCLIGAVGIYGTLAAMVILGVLFGPGF